MKTLQHFKNISVFQGC